MFQVCRDHNLMKRYVQPLLLHFAHTSRSSSRGLVVHSSSKLPGTLLKVPGTWTLRLPLASDVRVNVATCCWVGS